MPVLGTNREHRVNAEATILSYALQAGDRVFTFRFNRPAWLGTTSHRCRAAAGFLLGSVVAACVMWLLLAAPGFVSDRASTAAASTRTLH
jgi:hypothetical protein